MRGQSDLRGGRPGVSFSGGDGMAIAYRVGCSSTYCAGVVCGGGVVCEGGRGHGERCLPGTSAGQGMHCITPKCSLCTRVATTGPVAEMTQRLPRAPWPNAKAGAAHLHTTPWATTAMPPAQGVTLSHSFHPNKAGHVEPTAGLQSGWAPVLSIQQKRVGGCCL